ncbi:MAG: hypothetical protein LBP87_01595 [Planctomycetaceae bacterium]|jgi:hypothetical protein|nr:hypothetical protein [Planctomycetaceae bacterium]
MLFGVFKQYKNIIVIVCFSFLLFSAGCNRGRVRPEGLPKLHQCVIHLTQEGIPLSGASVLFLPVSPSQGKHWTVSGFSDETGKTEIYTNGYFRGSPQGEFKIIVTKTETVVPPFPDIMPTDPREIVKLERMIEKGTKVYKVISDEFTTEETTPLKIIVPTKENKTTFELGASIRKLVQ